MNSYILIFVQRHYWWHLPQRCEKIDSILRYFRSINPFLLNSLKHVNWTLNRLLTERSWVLNTKTVSWKYYLPFHFFHSSVLVDIVHRKASLSFQSLLDNSPFIYTIWSFLNHFRNIYFNNLQYASVRYEILNKNLASNCQRNFMMRGYYFIYYTRFCTTNYCVKIFIFFQASELQTILWSF